MTSTKTHSAERPGVYQRVRQAASSWNTPLHRSSYALLATTGANAALGMAFWVAAARLYPADVVGLGAGGISALQLAATVGWVGLQYTLMRYVPLAGRRTSHFTMIIYGVGAAAGLTASVVVVNLADGLQVPFVADNWLTVLAFCLGVAIWVIFSLQDAVLVGIRRSLFVPTENSVYGLLKLILLVVFAGAVHPWTLLGVWVGAAVVMTIAVTAVLFKSLLTGNEQPSQLPSPRSIARFSTGHSVVALASWLPELLVPLMVLHFLGEAENAYYYSAWTIAFSVKLLLTGMASALTVEAAYAEKSFRSLARAAARLSIVVLIPAVTVLVLAAELILRVFGADYVAGAGVLRYLSLSILPAAIVALVVALDMSRERFRAALTLTVTGAAISLALTAILLPVLGIDGAGLAWLIGQNIAAVIGVVILVRGRRTMKLEKSEVGGT